MLRYKTNRSNWYSSIFCDITEFPIYFTLGSLKKESSSSLISYENFVRVHIITNASNSTMPDTTGALKTNSLRCGSYIIYIHQHSSLHFSLINIFSFFLQNSSSQQILTKLWHVREENKNTKLSQWNINWKILKGRSKKFCCVHTHRGDVTDGLHIEDGKQLLYIHFLFMFDG